jgi:cobalt-zinc-cadmium efflux system protein
LNSTKHEHKHNDTHDHDHDKHNHGGHSHAHFPVEGAQGNAFKIGFALTSAFVLVEFTAGFFFNSLALISDAGHNLTDALALAFSWWALRMTRRAANYNKTYGYHRAGILAAMFNALTLALISIYIFYEGIHRLTNPPEVEGWAITGVASLALLVNLFVAWLLFRWSRQDLNTRSAFVHIATDAVASVGVIFAGVLEAITGWKAVDPLISILIGALILWSGWGIIKESVNILLEGIPDGLDMVGLIDALKSQPRVSDVHDLHVWTIGSGFRALSCHLKVDDECSLAEANQTVKQISHMLEEEYDIRHATIQVECQSCELDKSFCAIPR